MHWRIRPLSVVVCVLALLSLTACSTSASKDVKTSAPPRSGIAAEASSTPRPLVLAETAYRWIPPEARYPFNQSLDYAFVLKNPNSSFGATSAVLRVTMLDANGRVYFEEDLPILAVRPGETVVGGSQSFADRGPASVSFEVTTAPGAWVAARDWEPPGFKPLKVQGLRLLSNTGKLAPDMVGFPADYSYFTGVVENPNAVGFDEYVVDVVHRDSKGKLIAEYFEPGEKLMPNGKSAFRINTPDRLPVGDKYEAYARPWYGSEARLPISRSSK